MTSITLLFTVSLLSFMLFFVGSIVITLTVTIVVISKASVFDVCNIAFSLIANASY